MNQYIKKIIIESEKKDIKTQKFSEFISYLSLKRKNTVFEEYEMDKELLIYDKKYLMKNYSLEKQQEIQQKERFIELMKIYKSDKILSEKEDQELLELHNILIDWLSVEELNKWRKWYRAELNLAADFLEKVEGGDVVFPSLDINNVLLETKQWINCIVSFLINPSQVTEKEHDQYGVVEQKLIIERIPLMADSFSKYTNEIGYNKEIYGLMDLESPSKLEELKKESLNLLEKILFNEGDNQEWKMVIEKMEQRTMEDELINILEVFRNIQLEIELSNKKTGKLSKKLIRNSEECESNIVDFGKVMNKQIEKNKEQNDNREAEKLLERLKKI